MPSILYAFGLIFFIPLHNTAMIEKVHMEYSAWCNEHKQKWMIYSYHHFLSQNANEGETKSKQNKYRLHKDVKTVKFVGVFWFEWKD